MKKFRFKNGDSIDALGLGTWKSEPGDVFSAVISALEKGYRHIDCAVVYGNEPEIGEALQKAFNAGIVKREEVWITSKLWNNSHYRQDVEPALKKTLSDLKLDYLDLYLVHWPVAIKPDVDFPKQPDDFLSLEQVPILETWQGMEDMVDSGLTRHIGVSNFGQNRLHDLKSMSRIAPEMNQVELHPLLQQNELLQYCKREGIHVTAYSPLGSKDRSSTMKKENEPNLFENETIKSIAEKHDKTPAQILIAWAINRDTIVIPKSVNTGRIKQNFEAAEIELNKEDMEQISNLDKEYRYVDGSFWAMEGSPYDMEMLWK